jgi:hypothetical protein
VAGKRPRLGESEIARRLREELGIGPREQLSLPLQADHVTGNLHGGDRYETLRRAPVFPRSARSSTIIQSGGDSFFVVRKGLPPGGRAECRNGPRPCSFVHCKWHLWMIAGEDRRGYRPRPGEHPSSTLEPRWLDDPLPPSCALDIAESVKPGEELTYERLGEIFGLHPDVIGRIVRRALAKGRAGEPERAG